MSEQDVRGLVALEYDFIAADAAMGLILDRLATLPLVEEEVQNEVVRVRYALRAMLNKLDKPITEAVRLFEALEPAPF